MMWGHTAVQFLLSVWAAEVFHWHEHKLKSDQRWWMSQSWCGSSQWMLSADPFVRSAVTSGLAPTLCSLTYFFFKLLNIQNLSISLQINTIRKQETINSGTYQTSASAMIIQLLYVIIYSVLLWCKQSYQSNRQRWKRFKVIFFQAYLMWGSSQKYQLILGTG